MTDVLGDLRLDLRDLTGVLFVATSEDATGVRVQVVVDDPGVVADVERTVDALRHRQEHGDVRLEVSVAGARRSELAIASELRAIPGVASVDLDRGPRGELVRARVTTAGPAATARVEELVDRRLGRTVRRRRLEVVESAGRR